jgi:hypothetical protein
LASNATPYLCGAWKVPAWSKCDICSRDKSQVIFHAERPTAMPFSAIKTSNSTQTSKTSKPTTMPSSNRRSPASRSPNAPGEYQGTQLNGLSAGDTIRVNGYIPWLTKLYRAYHCSLSTFHHGRSINLAAANAETVEIGFCPIVVFKTLRENAESEGRMRKFSTFVTRHRNYYAIYLEIAAVLLILIILST